MTGPRRQWTQELARLAWHSLIARPWVMLDEYVNRPTLPQDARTGAEGYRDMATGEIGPQTGDGTLHSGEG